MTMQTARGGAKATVYMALDSDGNGDVEGGDGGGDETSNVRVCVEQRRARLTPANKLNWTE